MLIVEDDIVLADAIKIALESEGYNLLMAQDGNEALDILSANKVNMVLLDLLLPNKNGFEVLKEMKGNINQRDIPVLILTNFEQEASIEDAIKMGAVDYLIKANINIKDIPGLVSKYI